MREIKLLLFISLLLAMAGSVTAHPASPPRSAAPDPPPIVRHVPPLPDSGVMAPAAPSTEWTYHKTADGQHPDGNEQAMMWLMNRARANPTQEGSWLATTDIPDIAGGRDYFGVDIAVLQAEFASYSAKPPAAFDVRLYHAAKAHSDYLISVDEQSHDGQFQRIQDAGFSYGGGSGYSARGSVFVWARSNLNAHGAFNIDWGGGTDDGMQSGRGHRMAIMSIDGDYTNVGYALVPESDPGTSVGPLVTTGNYCHANPSAANHYNTFIVGTVWQDADGDALYDPGEGIGGVTVMPDTGTYYAITGDSGGYAIPILNSGAYVVTFSGPATGQGTVTVDGASKLLDLVVGPTYSIAGCVRGPSGMLSGVLITASGGYTTTTDHNGNYTLSGLSAGSYTLTPSMPGMTFTPASREVSLIDNDIAGQDFTGTPLSYAISGTVTAEGGAPLADVTLTTNAGMWTTSDAGGAYAFNNLLPGTYTITPTKTHYAFAPVARAVTLTDGAVSGQDFAGTLLVYDISGTVTTEDGAPLAGVYLSTGVSQTTSDASGAYTLTGLLAGTYTLTPQLAGYAFAPVTHSVTLVDHDAGGVDFVATRTYTVSGAIYDSGGVPVLDVTVRAGTYTGTTGRSGAYTITGLVSGTYTLVPQKSGFAFLPPSRQLTITTTDVTGQDFSVADLRLSPGQTRSGLPETSRSYTHTLTNTSAVTESYTLSASNDHDWPISLFTTGTPEITTTLPLTGVGPGMHATFALSVTIPAGIAPHIRAHTYLTATSSTSVTVTIVDVTVVEAVTRYVYLPLVMRQ